jgi:hypothetical protein
MEKLWFKKHPSLKEGYLRAWKGDDDFLSVVFGWGGAFCLLYFFSVIFLYVVSLFSKSLEIYLQPLYLFLLMSLSYVYGIFLYRSVDINRTESDGRFRLFLLFFFIAFILFVEANLFAFFDLFKSNAVLIRERAILGNFSVVYENIKWFFLFFFIMMYLFCTIFNMRFFLALLMTVLIFILSSKFLLTI